MMAMEHADLTPSSRYGLVTARSAKRPKLQIVRTQTNGDAVAIVKGAFASWARRYRMSMPLLYEKVDRELRKPNRKPQSSQLGSLPYSGSLEECPRCGEDFPTMGKPARFCSIECHDEHKSFCKRTGRRFNRPGAGRPRKGVC